MKYFVVKKCEVFLEAGQKFSDDMDTSGRKPARFCLSHLEGDECMWIPRQDYRTTPMCNPGTVQCSVPLSRNSPVAGALEIQGYLFFNSTAGGLFLGSWSIRNLGHLQQRSSQVCLCQNWKLMVSRLTPSPGVTFLAGDCSVILYLPQALEFVPSRISLEAGGSVLLQALSPGAEYQSPRSPRWNRDQAASKTARASPASLG